MTAAERIESEELLLAAFCQDAFPESDRAAAIRRLSSYPFVSNFHQLAYRALASLPTKDPQSLRELLPVRLNNLGFPDTDWESLFTPRDFKRADLTAKLDALLAP